MNRKKYYKHIIILISFVIVVSVLWNNYDFSKRFKYNERSKMEILAKAYDRFGTNNLNQDFSLEAKVSESNHVIVMSRNLDSLKMKNSSFLIEQLEIMKKENSPIVIDYLENKKYHIYYKDSDLLTRLQYYPLLLVLTLVFFSGVIYLALRSNKISEQNKLWVGMAKETAHQIGTPLSSLMGWIELMKLDNSVPLIVPELEKDITRLNIIAERFSKIGSVPEKLSLDVLPILKKTLAYFESRSSKNIVFIFDSQETEAVIDVSEQLFTWVLENLIKNAIDAMAGKGTLSILLRKVGDKIFICVKDTGKGIPKKQFKKIFTPGFTTKKRGWGLGLSLSKRIVEDYHMGKIFVKKSELQKGSVFEIQLPV
jgi:two-component system, sporulation sensor kinase D